MVFVYSPPSAGAKRVVSPTVKTESDEMFDCIHEYLSFLLLYGVDDRQGEEC